MRTFSQSPPTRRIESVSSTGSVRPAIMASCIGRIAAGILSGIGTEATERACTSARTSRSGSPRICRIWPSNQSASALSCGASGSGPTSNLTNGESAARRIERRRSVGASSRSKTTFAARPAASSANAARTARLRSSVNNNRPSPCVTPSAKSSMASNCPPKDCGINVRRKENRPFTATPLHRPRGCSHRPRRWRSALAWRDRLRSCGAIG